MPVHELINDAVMAALTRAGLADGCEVSIQRDGGLYGVAVIRGGNVMGGSCFKIDPDRAHAANVRDIAFVADAVAERCREYADGR